LPANPEPYVAPIITGEAREPKNTAFRLNNEVTLITGVAIGRNKSMTHKGVRGLIIVVVKGCISQ